MGRNGGGKIDRRREQAIVALLQCKDIATAAERAGIGLRTLQRWLGEDEGFKTAYREARRQTVSQAISQLQQACGEAVGCLKEIMNDHSAPASSRVAAARAVLDQALRAIEVEDVLTRLDALELSFSQGKSTL